MAFKAQFGRGLPTPFTYMDSLADFLQYAHAYYAACVVALMREDDVEKELRKGDTISILRALWDEREYIVSRAASSPNTGLGYDPIDAVLWCSRDELSRLLLRKTTPTAQTTSMASDARAVFTTLYWDKPFYTYTTRFLADPTFHHWAPAPFASSHDKLARNPFEALSPSRRHLLRCVEEHWPSEFALRPTDTLRYQGVLFHGYQDKVAVLGISKDRHTREYLTRASAQNQHVNKVGEAFFQPQTRYHMLKGDLVVLEKDFEAMRERFLLLRTTGMTHTEIQEKMQLGELETERVLEDHPLSTSNEWL